MRTKTKNKTFTTKKIVTMAMLSAIALILLMIPFLRFPLIPMVPFLEYDAMDVPILFGGFLFGPVGGLVITVLCALIQGATVSLSTGGLYGIIMHIIATGAFVSMSAFIYKKKPTTKILIFSLIAGVIAMTIIMIPANLLITPLFMGTPVKAVVTLLPFIILFNVLKATINAVVTFILYLPMQKHLKKLELNEN